MSAPTGNQRPLSPYVFIFLCLSALTACQPSAITGAVINAQDQQPTAVIATATLINPPVLYTVPPPTAPLPSFSLVDPTAVAYESPTPAPTATLPPTAVPSATATPPPTFTPPALPFTSPWEHYWLRRPVAEGGVVWTDKAYPYGHTRGGTLRPHHGVEFNVTTGTEILATASGTVVVAGNDSVTAYGPEKDFYGNLVIIELDTQLENQPVYTLYAHLSQLLVTEGQHIEAQEVIALSGATGIADGPHMHFEVRVGQNDYQSTRNPLLWLYPFPDRGTLAGRVLWANSEPVFEVPLTAHRIDATSQYAATTTYANETVNSDAGWDENFVLDDIEAGYYEVTVEIHGRKYSQTVWVYPYRTSFVEIVLDVGD